MTRMVVSDPVSELLEKDSCSAPRFDLGSSEPRRPGQYVLISEVHNIARGLKGRISRNSTDLLPQFQALLPPRLRSVLIGVVRIRDQREARAGRSGLAGGHDKSWSGPDDSAPSPWPRLTRSRRLYWEQYPNEVGVGVGYTRRTTQAKRRLAGTHPDAVDQSTLSFSSLVFQPTSPPPPPLLSVSTRGHLGQHRHTSMTSS